ncbi:hypothetical protein [Antarcticimicrobium sediminis]|uniref:Uncharacterized protein n=1 Tax=Antarcticimicrobium sediminis TaxID=2546227 RepID=A0A4R5EGS4_9RHOB|nr:hypothetical protein [Antarcticimicrobium sediminis]TDE33639.1 hypothetical protein E1B25_21080 [Antarcticimicrobium sediminis]
MTKKFAPPERQMPPPPPATPVNGWSFPDFNLADVTAFYEHLVCRATRQVDADKPADAMVTIREAANLAYLVNWRYQDDRLENLLSRISARLLPGMPPPPRDSARIVFFDSWGLDARGLSLQYIRALKAYGAPLLYICENRNEAASTQLREELARASAAEVLYLDDVSGPVEKTRKIFDAATAFAATQIMMHMTPWAVEAIIAFRAMPNVVKYQINLTDHAFWLGTSCTDYSLEFREYGRTLTSTQRGLPADRVILNPYYPIIEDNRKDPLPDRRPGDTVVFTGGAYYKMYGRGGYFFDLIANLLDNHDDLIVWIAGNGHTKILEDKLQRYIRDGRVMLIGNRKDINAVFKACDIYLSTYPFCGGLMAQLATVHERPVLSFTSADLVTNRLEDIIGTGETPEITTTDVERFRQMASELIEDREKRTHRARAIKATMHNRADFEARVFDILTRPEAMHDATARPLELEHHAVTSLYLEIENDFQDQLARRILHNTGFWSTLRFPAVTAKAALKVAYFIVTKSLQRT